MGQRQFFGAAFLCGLTMTATATASPWGQPQSALFAIEKLDHFTASGSGRSFEQRSSETYLEYGLLENVTIGGKLSFGSQETDFANSQTLTREGILDAELFIQRQFGIGERGKISPYILYAPETSLISLNTGNASGRDAATELGAGFGWGGDGLFLSSQWGARLSHGRDADQLRGQLTLGRHAGRVLLLGEAFSTTSLGTPEEGGTNYDVTSFTVSAVYQLTPQMRVQAGAGKDVTGSNLDKGERIFVALWVTP